MQLLVPVNRFLENCEQNAFLKLSKIVGKFERVFQKNSTININNRVRLIWTEMNIYKIQTS